MKRRDLLKAIGLGAVIAPAVVSVKAVEPKFKHEEYSMPLLLDDYEEGVINGTKWTRIGDRVYYNGNAMRMKDDPFTHIKRIAF